MERNNPEPTPTHRLMSKPTLKRLLAAVAWSSSVFAVALAGTVAAGYLFAVRIAGQQFDISNLLQGEFLWPLIGVSVAITLGLSWVLLFIETRLSRYPDVPVQNDEPESASEAGNRIQHGYSDREYSLRLLKLKRNADRLNEVEQDLIRKLSEGHEMDIATEQLLTEIQICTHRLMAQLADLQRNDRHNETTARSGESHEQVPQVY